MRVLAALACAAIVTGCAGEQHTSTRGRAIFERDCSRCHTLTGHDTDAPGGDLRLGHLGSAAIASFARVMPVDPPLDGVELRAVAEYVARR